ncbi:hypothetical protein MSTE_03788 [Mycobacteroides stephanolepidis]|uniref:Lipoprotein LpqN n=1 Tax=[Mycobacterium] stephanolepidis TaxID=1520670 RepID=A0A1Z4F1J9_9MYCO|nr:hypothetical protein MSTE_03788 [[Mycobacterium] stephanolepidis]
MVAAVVVTLVSLAAGGCSARTDKECEAPDSRSAGTDVAHDMTLDEYLTSHGVRAAVQTRADISDFGIGMQQPPHWYVTREHQLPNTYVVVSNTDAVDQSFVPNAVLIVHRLTGDFSQEEAIRRGSVDTERYDGFVLESEKVEDFQHGLSSVISGTYNDQGKRLHVVNRYVLATVHDTRYLILNTITTTADQFPSLSGDVKYFDEGIKIFIR